MLHLHLISAQPVPNLAAALDRALGVRQVVQLVSPDMQQQARWQANVLQRHGIEAIPYPLEDAWNFSAIRERVQSLLDRYGGQNIALNATGGTKIMSIAAWSVFQQADLPAFYIHPRDDRLIWLHPSGRPSHPLENRIRLEDFLAAHGARVCSPLRRTLPHPSWLEIGQLLVEQMHRYEKAVNHLNFLASQAMPERPGDDAPLIVPLKKGRPSRELNQLLSLMRRHGIVDLPRDRRHIVFPTDQARFFANGGWLEEWVFRQVERLRQQDPLIQDIAASVEVDWYRDTPVKNELDVAILRDNRLHIIECKTVNYQARPNRAKSSELLYKVETLADILGGLRAQPIIVSYSRFRQSDYQRARNLGVPTITGSGLKTFSHRLQRLLYRNEP